MVFDPASASLGDFYRDQVLPRLTAEGVYNDPAHQWQKGRDKWRGACPWHTSQSGSSFNVTLDGLPWYCAGCGVGGGPIQYRWRQAGGLGSPLGSDFVAVLRELADLAGVPFPERELSPEERAAAENRAARASALESVYALCQRELWSERGETARAYLHSRGLDDDAVRDLELGLYPGAAAVRQVLADAGHGTSINEGVWDKVRGYVTFPWRDEHGHALTLYGRWPGPAAPAGQAKTLALPGEGSKASPLYFERARRTGRTSLVLVEGLLDAALAQARGQVDVVAYVAGQPSLAQLETLRRCGVKVATICPDPDAGGDAGIRSFLKNVDPTIRTYVAPRLPDNVDPDEYILAHGVDAWRAHLDGGVKGVTYLTRAILADHDVRTAKGRDDALERLTEYAATVADGEDLEELTTLAAEALGMRAPKVKERFQKARRARPAEEPPPSPKPAAVPYVAGAGGIVWLKDTREGPARVPLTNFTARITADVAEDDGAEVRRLFEIEARLNGRSACFPLPAERFAGMGWATEHLGAGAIVYPGFGLKDHARAAVQILSGDVPEQRVFAHLGWRKIGDTWAYLHAGGAIGPHGPVPGVEVRLPEALSRYALPDPPRGVEAPAAVRASLRLLGVTPESVTVPIYAAIWRAVLGPSDHGIHAAGPTGAGKSELGALVQQHFGAGLDARHLPGSWSSTANSLEALAFAAKDALLCIDDFAPTGSAVDVQRMHREADRVIRAQGNNSGRQRMRADGSLRAAKPPRGMILSTGEDVPRGQSLRARLFVLEIAPGDVDWARLTACQADAAAGLYAQALAGFLQWLAPRYAEVQRRLRTEVAILRERALQSGSHKRTPEIVANLATGLGAFLAYAQDVGAMARAEAESLWRRGWAALGMAAAVQAQHQAASEPTRRFLELLSGALAAGRAHVAGPSGAEPDSAKAWGWRLHVVGTGEYQRAERRPEGERIGWLEGDDLYLEPEASYAVAQRLARDSGDALAVTGTTLHKRLSEQGLLASTEQARGKLTVRRTLEGQRRPVLHLRAGSLMVQESAQSAQSAQSDGAAEAPIWSMGGAGPIPWADFLDAGAKPAHETGPQRPADQEASTAPGPIGPVGPVPETQTDERVNGAAHAAVREVLEL